ncbi:hypothetical protein GALMADRAFT_149463 [Galerina marginata CBS 339.88]|uniref:SP-RING-type domain-containing protein n=1 Tax=Galerina marginata (strain CBS 339.88) TaxID=685588 RepID=A0A067U0T8_GALM3|nr:hypothetical protein GALMADRAFT_149463 [Galerina marginata CBS 339.88]
MASTDVWMDFDALKHGVKNNTVDRLKQILAGFNEECGTHFSKSGKKQEIIDRITHTLDSWRTGDYQDKWMRAKAILYQVRTTGIYTPSRLPPLSAGLPTSASSLHSTFDPPKINPYATSHAGSSSIGHYDPYAPPRRPSGVSAPIPSSSSGLKVPGSVSTHNQTSSNLTSSIGVRFKESPFFTVDQAISSLVECPESTSATDRRSQSLTFSLSADQSAKMKSGSRYQLRLFCTSSIFYAGAGSFRTSTLACPMEFPPTCEVRVNNTQITANLKGLKKKPGTAPPPDIGKYSRITSTNRVEMVYVNSQQPVQSKKYYMIVMLVEATTIDALVTNLRGQHLWTAQDVRQRMIQAMSEDDDIIAGPQRMSLKCPLTFVRITTPCRSSKCVHPQCFDATSWFTMMEQTTTWLCPVCERMLDHRDLIMDGYFDEILKRTPESVEDVMVEADGQWHTSDNKYGSSEWLAAHPKLTSPSKKPPPPIENPSRTTANVNGSGQPNGNGKSKDPNIEIYVLDSDDDEDEGRVKRELSPSYTSSAGRSFEGTLPQSQTSQSQSQLQQGGADVIDLTLDSEDEDDQPIMTHAHGKRKATDTGFDHSIPTDQTWKKSRVDPSSRILPAPRGASMNGAASVLHTSSINNHSPSSPGRYTSSFSGNTLPPPPVYPTYDARNSTFRLPPLTHPSYARLPHDSRWPE